MSTARSIVFNASSAVLVRYYDGQPALWVVDRFATGAVDSLESLERFSIDDINESVPLSPTELLEPIVAEWKRNVGWDEDTCNTEERG